MALLHARFIGGAAPAGPAPGVAEMEAEARSRDNGKLAALVDSLRMALGGGARSVGARVEATIKQEYTAYQVSEVLPRTSVTDDGTLTRVQPRR